MERPNSNPFIEPAACDSGNPFLSENASPSNPPTAKPSLSPELTSHIPTRLEKTKNQGQVPTYRRETMGGTNPTTSSDSHQHHLSSSASSSWDGIAVRLLSEKFLLTALELHAELIEAGRELPRLTNFFSNPANFDLTAGTSLPSFAASNSSLANISRSCSQTTLDSLDWACGGSEEGGPGGAGGGGGEERLHLLEFELRRARETIQALRNTLTQATATASPSTASSSSCAATGVDDLPSGPQWRGVGPIKEGIPLQPHQKATINFLVGEYLSAQGYKMAAITLAEEDGNQEFENWDDVGLNMPRPPALAKLVCEPQQAVASPSQSESKQTPSASTGSKEVASHDTPKGTRLLQTGATDTDRQRLGKADISSKLSLTLSSRATVPVSDEEVSPGNDGEDTFRAGDVGAARPDLKSVSAELMEMRRRCSMQERELLHLRQFASTPSATPVSSPMKSEMVPDRAMTTSSSEEIFYAPRNKLKLFAGSSEAPLSDLVMATVMRDGPVAESDVSLNQKEGTPQASDMYYPDTERGGGFYDVNAPPESIEDIIENAHSGAGMQKRNNTMNFTVEDVRLEEPADEHISLEAVNVNSTVYPNGCAADRVSDNEPLLIHKNGLGDTLVSQWTGLFGLGEEEGGKTVAVTAEEFLRRTTKVVVAALRRNNGSTEPSVHCWASIAASCLYHCCLIAEETASKGSPSPNSPAKAELTPVQHQLCQLSGCSSRHSSAAIAAMLPLLLSTLRNVAPNVLLAKREELAPLLMLCLLQSRNERQHTELLTLLLWLSKRPDARQRATITMTLLLVLLAVKNPPPNLCDGRAERSNPDGLENEAKLLTDEDAVLQEDGTIDSAEGFEERESVHSKNRIHRDDLNSEILSNGSLSGQEVLSLVCRLLDSKHSEQRLLGVSCATVLAMHCATSRHCLPAMQATVPDTLVDILQDRLIAETDLDVREAVLSSLAFLLCLPLSHAVTESVLDAFVNSLQEHFWPSLVEQSSGVSPHREVEYHISIRKAAQVNVHESGFVLLHRALAQKYHAQGKIVDFLNSLIKQLQESVDKSCDIANEKTKEVGNSVLSRSNSSDNLRVASLVIAIDKSLPYLLASLSRTCSVSDATPFETVVPHNIKWMLRNLEGVIGNEEEGGDSEAKFCLLRQSLSQEWFKAWPLFDHLTKTLLPSLVLSVDNFEALDGEVVQAFIDLFYDWSACFGEAATWVHIVPLFHQLLSVGESDLEKIRSGATSLTRAPVIIFTVSILGSQHHQTASNTQQSCGTSSGPLDPNAQASPLQEFLSRHVSIMCLCGASLVAAEKSVSALLGSLPGTEAAVLAVLWSCLVNKSPLVRGASGRMWTVAAGLVGPAVLSGRVVPGLVTLATDGEAEVRAAALRPLVTAATAAADGGDAQVVGKCSVQLESVLEESQLVQHPSLQLALASVTAECAAVAHDKLLYNVLLARLCCCVTALCSGAGPSEALMVGCVAAYSAVLQRSPPQHIVAHFVLPPLQQLVPRCSGQLSADVPHLIREFTHLMQLPPQDLPAPRRSSVVVGSSATSLLQGVAGTTTSTGNVGGSHSGGGGQVASGTIGSSVGAVSGSNVTSPVEDVRYKMSKMFSSGRQVAERANVNFPSLFKKK